MGQRKPQLRMNVDELQVWAATMADAVWQAPEDAAGVVVTDELDDEHPDGTVVAAAVSVEDGQQGMSDTVNHLVIETGPRSVAGLATRVMWTPDGTISTPAWALVVVARRLPALMLVRRQREDDRWWVITSEDLPWFAALTARGLRAALVQREPMVIQEVPTDDRRLLNKVRTTKDNPALRPPIGGS